MEEKNRLGSEEEFWKRYTKEDGTKFRWQEILKALQLSRRNAAVAGAEAARRFFAGDFTSEMAQRIFAHTKNGRTRPCIHDATIAQKWSVLLETNSDVRGRWEEMNQQ